MKFQDMKHETIHYKGRGYRAWRVETSPGVRTLFAEMDLMNALEYGGDMGGRIDDLVGYYVHPGEEISSAVEEYND